ncbi:MAG TPA: tripartite tricarboxylate transporter substrate binding protein [Burkholderiales bacterium]|nr:tripartite tricarboxylate transporter substrate binding protein [Burkholderiales bacterium]
MKRVLSIACTSVAVLSSLNVEHALAQAYPAKPVRMVIGFAPGGPADIVARLVSPKASESLGQQIVIENRGGASGTIGAEVVAKSAPDGYTIGLGTSGNLIMAQHLYPKIGYNVQKDFVPISCLAQTAYVVAINPTVPAKTIGELVKIARSKKGALTYGTSGNGSTSHIAAELFRGAIDADLVHVPYKGTGPAMAAVVAGEIDMMLGDMSPALPHAKAGRMRILANLSNRRSSAAPHLPTIAEAGVKMPPVVGRSAVFAPAGTSKEIVSRLHAAFMTAIKAPELQQRFEQAGIEPVGEAPEQCAATLRAEGEMYGGVIRKAGIRAD